MVQHLTRRNPAARARARPLPQRWGSM